MSARFDLVVVGAGPGGMAAAVVAAEAGLRVCLIDDNPAVGGQIWRRDARVVVNKNSEALKWGARLSATGCELMQGWQVVDQRVPGVLLLEHEGEGQEIGFERLILACGARERFLPFPGCTLPGVMGLGGVQALVKGGMIAEGKRVVVAGSGPLLLAVAASLVSAGARVGSVNEQARLAQLARLGVELLKHPGKLIEGARYWRAIGGASFRMGCWVVRAEGRDRVEQVTLSDGKREWTEVCDWLACGFYLVPNLELPRLLGCQIEDGVVRVDELQESSVRGVACIGELTGVGGLEKALLEGEIAGSNAAGRSEEARRLARGKKRWLRFAEQLESAFGLRSELRGLADAETIVCRCEDVKHGELEKCGGWREAKLQTRCGMGSCQGRVCGGAAEFVYGWESAGMRPPVFPARAGTMAGVEDVRVGD